MNGYIFLAIAIASEIIATSLMKYSQGFTRLLPALLASACYVNCYFCLSHALHKLQMNVAYGLWSAVGIPAMTLIGYLFFDEVVTPTQGVALSLIISGILLLYV